MDKTDIREIISMMEEASLTKLEFQTSDFRLLLEKTAVTEPVLANINVKDKPVGEVVNKSGSVGELITSPLVGTLYLSASQGADPFVSIGSKVNKDDIICLIEAMKMFSEVKSDYSGIIKEILVKDSETVEFGTPLFRIEQIE